MRESGACASFLGSAPALAVIPSPGLAFGRQGFQARLRGAAATSGWCDSWRRSGDADESNRREHHAIRRGQHRARRARLHQRQIPWQPGKPRAALLRIQATVEQRLQILNRHPAVPDPRRADLRGGHARCPPGEHHGRRGVGAAVITETSNASTGTVLSDSGGAADTSAVARGRSRLPGWIGASGSYRHSLLRFRAIQPSAVIRPRLRPLMVARRRTRRRQ